MQCNTCVGHVISYFRIRILAKLSDLSIVSEGKYGNLMTESHCENGLSMQCHEIEVTNVVRSRSNVDDTGLCLQISDVMYVNNSPPRV